MTTLLLAGSALCILLAVVVVMLTLIQAESPTASTLQTLEGIND